MEIDYDFAFYLTVATLVTGTIYLLDKLFWEKKRRAGADSADDSDEPGKARKEPAVVEFSKSFFPVLLLVLLIRSFIAEPFRIPSSSMLPTLLVGDFLVVSKYSYGIRLPVINKKIIDIGEPQRGDVVVFRYPVDPSLDYIKRVVGLPGDTIRYQDKRLTINGKPLAYTDLAEGQYTDRRGNQFAVQQMQEDLLGWVHTIQVHKGSRRGSRLDYDFSLSVPQGSYFVLGDNRDNSGDSRVWGFVPEANLVGKAQFIWMHLGFDGLHRIGTSIQ